MRSPIVLLFSKLVSPRCSDFHLNLIFDISWSSWLLWVVHFLKSGFQNEFHLMSISICTLYSPLYYPQNSVGPSTCLSTLFRWFEIAMHDDTSIPLFSCLLFYVFTHNSYQRLSSCLPACITEHFHKLNSIWFCPQANELAFLSRFMASFHLIRCQFLCLVLCCWWILRFNCLSIMWCDYTTPLHAIRLFSKASYYVNF